MRNRVSRLALIAAGIGLVIGIPAIGQDAPESLLPPGFGDPVTAPPPPPVSSQRPSTATPAPDSATPRPSASDPLALDGLEETADEALETVALPTMPVVPLGNVGPLTAMDGGLPADAFGGTSGASLATMMHRLDAPLPSRWASILLRRTLLSNVPTPAGIKPADWIAERSWLLLRMGEADSARLLVQSADPSQFSPYLFEIAMQTYLALGDPGGLCPLADPASGVSRETAWILARAMCAALGGEPGTASAAIDQARRARLDGRRTFDLLLAEKVVGAGVDGRRSVTIEWEGVDRLTSWRYGLATATGVAIPAPLLTAAPSRVQGWRASAPLLPDSEKLDAGRRAAVLGVLSSAALIDLYGGVLDRTDPSEISASPATKVRRAFTGSDEGQRIEAMRDLWTASEDRTERYAALILTARAAAMVPVNQDYAEDAPRLIGAMLSAGYDTRAAGWADVAGSGEGWALLALGAARPVVPVSASGFGSYAGSVDPVKARLVLAGLAGLGRLNAQDVAAAAGDLDVNLNAESPWSLLLESAVTARQPGTVVLLAAIGMQTSDWRNVPPAHLYRIISALRRVGLEPEARMIAAEAAARL
ncbi:hypothetical protein FHS49_002995 [Sphingobium boeckii]|uniref:Uncharacterized protein n=1 Tax=Sphingobium boeckii TaxID=1082345 RepID=A0A7W9AK68_9SPHN|nr:hypothetical protein [Sphingobium boeckii]